MKKHIYSTINEYRNQLELPFDNKHPLHDKPLHIHVLDSLLNLSKKLIDVEDFYTPYTKVDIEKMWNSNLDDAFKIFKNTFHSNLLTYKEIRDVFFNTYKPSVHPELYSELVNIKIRTGLSDVDAFDALGIDVADEDTSKFIRLLTIKAINIIQDSDFIRLVFDDRMGKTTVLETLKSSIMKNGVVPIWRAITYRQRSPDAFTYLQQYNGVGECWTFDEKAAYPYYGSITSFYVLHAFVSPDAINWPQTIYKSVWGLKHEREVEVLNYEHVLLYKITTKQGEKLPIQKPMLIPV